LLLWQVTGIPSFFITVTANPRDKDMTAEGSINLNDGSLNTDVVNRLFKCKTELFRKDLIENKVLGNVRNYVQVTEFQKRGLPHIHAVVTLDRKVCFFWRELYLNLQPPISIDRSRRQMTWTLWLRAGCRTPFWRKSCMNW
jgi:Helitron helicase-like domain at N-terminus